MKKTRGKVRLLLIVFLLITCSVTVSGQMLEEFELVSENRQLKLYINRETTAIAVQKKESGHIWYSNPPQRDTIETMARGRTRDRLEAQLAISYYTPRDRRHYLNSYTDSVQHDQQEISLIDGGVRIDFQIGQKWDEEDVIPVMISDERFQEMIFDKISSAVDKDLVEDLYRKVSLKEKPEGFERVNVHGVDKEELFGEYILVSDEELTAGERRNFINNYLNRLEENRNAYDSLGDIGWHDIKHLLEAPSYVLRERIAAWDREDLADLLYRIDYSPEEVIFDHQQNNLDPPAANIRVFNIPLEYRLEGETLTANIPADEITYPVDVPDPDQDGQLSTFPLYSINLLEFFTAAPPDTDGYIFVPDGSGALIDLNKDTGSTSYQQRLYGPDFSERARDEMEYPAKQLHLPVFGLKQDEQAWLGIIEKGDAIARINASVSGQTFDYNRVFPGFVTMPAAEVSLTGSGDLSDDLEDALQDQSMNVYQARLFDKDIKVRYVFLEDEEATYSGMATSYREYLVDKHQLRRLNPVEELPFMLELTGSIHATEPVMGVPRRVVRPLTEYSQVKNILEQMSSLGIEDYKVVYQGWLDGGTNHNYPHKLNLEGKVGSRKEIINLIEFLEESEIDFYPEVSFLNVYNNRPGNGFSTRRDAARFIDRQRAFIYQYNIASFMRERREKHIHSPAGFEKVITSFVGDYNELGNTALALRYPGQQLNSDFNRKNVIDRQDAAALLEAELNSLTTDHRLDLLVRGANVQVLPYAQTLLEVPMYSSGHNIIDRGIPFLQMVLHGYFNFAGTAFNLTDNLEEYVLKSVETGSLPYYHFISEPSYTSKGTDFNNLFAVYFEDWLEEAAEHYQLFNETLAKLHHLSITEHQKVNEDVFITTYEDGSIIGINYGREEVMVMGKQIPARDFVILNTGSELQ